jgi:hypothetical protein
MLLTDNFAVAVTVLITSAFTTILAIADTTITLTVNTITSGVIIVFFPVPNPLSLSTVMDVMLMRVDVRNCLDESNYLVNFEQMTFRIFIIFLEPAYVYYDLNPLQILNPSKNDRFLLLSHLYHLAPYLIPLIRLGTIGLLTLNSFSPYLTLPTIEGSRMYSLCSSFCPNVKQSFS